jgi:hypothetical protein
MDVSERIALGKSSSVAHQANGNKYYEQANSSARLHYDWTHQVQQVAGLTVIQMPLSDDASRRIHPQGPNCYRDDRTKYRDENQLVTDGFTVLEIGRDAGRRGTRAGFRSIGIH